jgi:hypothetical protein
MSALLCALPYKGGARLGTKVPPRRWLGTLTAALIAALALAAFARLALKLDEMVGYYPPTVLRIDKSVIYLSVLGVIVYLFFGLRSVLSGGELYDLRRLRAAVSWRRAGMAALALLAVRELRHVFWNGEVMPWGQPKWFVIYTFLSSLTEPLIFLVAHVIYYGPAILLLALFWRRFCDHLDEYGLGLRALVFVNLLLSVNPQSRYQINVVAIFVAVLVKLLDGTVLRRQRLVAWLLICLACSKVWYVMNTAPQVYDGTMESLQRFPLQHYFMNSGPWMSHGMYYAQGGAVMLLAILLYFFVRRVQNEAEIGDPLKSGAPTR